MEEKIKQFLKTVKVNEQMLSMLFGIVTVILVGLVVYRMYGTNKPVITDEGAKTESEKQEQVEVAKVGEVEVTVNDKGEKVPSKLPETYKVKKGDDLWKIAKENYGSGYNWVNIAKANGLSNPNVIVEGQELKLPKVAVIEVGEKIQVKENIASDQKIEGDSYTVVKGDSLWTICVKAYGDGYKWFEVAKANNLTQPNQIEVGQKLKLPRN